MSDDYTPLPARELPPARLSQRKQHLLREIEQPTPPSARLGLPAFLGPRVRPRLLAAAVVLALAAIAVTVVVRGGTEAASAAEVREKIAQGLRLGQSISGEFSVQTRQPSARPRNAPGCLNCMPVVPLPSRFVIGADGSYSSLTLPLAASTRHDIAYNAQTGVETSFGDFTDNKGRPIYLRTFNLDPSYREYSTEAQLATWVHRALTERNPHVKATDLDGRPAWALSITFKPGESGYDAFGARLDVVVDRETGLVLQVTQYAYDAGRWTSIETLHDLKIGVETSPDDFVVPKPADAIELSHDYGFRRVPPSQATKIVGYRPLLPTITLGQPLTDFAVAEISRFPFPGIPVRRNVVSARYGRGLDTITVSSYRGPVTDLPQIGSGRTVRLARGPLAGDLASLSNATLGGGALTVFHNPHHRSWDLRARGLLIQVTAPSPAQALAIANSLRPQ